MELCSDLICIYSAVPNNGGGRGLIKMGEGGPTDNLNINKQGVQIRKLFSVRSGNTLPLIMGIVLAKSQSARVASHQPDFIGDCLTTSHKCLPSHGFASFAFLMFSVFTFQ